MVDRIKQFIGGAEEWSKPSPNYPLKEGDRLRCNKCGELMGYDIPRETFTCSCREHGVESEAVTYIGGGEASIYDITVVEDAE